ncbi:MFS transporter [Kitasatospora sp. NPDC051853]|uniref:MFS transporter n=1 Tax=Kitasatospora sp. NPDC051853 TaxID=3364058 RepID=UPI0037B452FD
MSASSSASASSAATGAGAGAAGREADPPEQRRTLAVLIAAQTLSGAGLAAGITVGALLAGDLLGSTGLAGIPSALFTGGAVLGALAIGRICQRHGRRPGLAAGYAAGALGSLGVVAAVAAHHVPLLLFSLFVYGAGTATNLQARYAGADLAPPHRRGRAVSAVLLATTFGAVVGPNLVTVSGTLAEGWGIPALAGPFLLAAAAYGAAAVLLGALLRPDPLLLARRLAAAGPAEAPSAGSVDTDTVAAAGAETTATRGPGLATGLWVMLLGQLVMIAVMTMTPVHLDDHGHGTGATGLVIALHVGAMFLPSPLSGRLVDRCGPVPVAVAGGLTLAAAGVLAAAAPPHSVGAVATALVLLGLGWNLGLVSGTAIVTAAVPLERRASTQGLVDVGLAIAGSTGGLASGAVVALGGYPVLAVGGAAVALLVVPVALATARRPGGAPPRRVSGP